MQFTTLLVSFAAVLAASAAPLDVFVPQITSPNETTTWIVGQAVNVTWKTDDAPVNITNKQGTVRLRQNGLTLANQTLADGFDITTGFVEVTPPDVQDGEYQIVLFGDSGNFSPLFKIAHEVTSNV